MTIRILTGDCRDVLASLPHDSVHCCVTSPPYWGLRDYGVAGQLGLEPTFTEYVDKMVGVFRAVRRVLRPDGTLWLNLGDSYATGAGKVGGCPGGGEQGARWAGTNSKRAAMGKHEYIGERIGVGPTSQPNRMPQPGLKPKDLCGIPWRVAFALQEDGWWLRQDIIWSKPNPMPESVTDRCTKAHEYLFLLTKSARYFYDAEAIKEPLGAATLERGYTAQKMERGGTPKEHSNSDPLVRQGKGWWDKPYVPSSRNKRSVWEIATSPFPEAHFATFPPALVEPCIKAGTSEKGCCGKCGAPWGRQVKKSGGTTGKSWHNHKDDLALGQRGGNHGRNDAAAGMADYRVETLGWRPTCACQAPVIPCAVLDLFCGAGTTGLVADRLQRDVILIELNPDYAAMARRRIFEDAPLFSEAAE